MLIRTAEQRDIPALLDIYNHEVTNGSATFDIEPKTLEEWTHWFEAHNTGNHPLIVAEEDGCAIAYASLSTYREKQAYSTTVELSVYVRHDCRRRGVAEALMRRIISMAQDDPRTHMVVSVITSTNAASIALHEKLGFSFCGMMHEVGLKRGEYLSINNFELAV